MKLKPTRYDLELTEEDDPGSGWRHTRVVVIEDSEWGWQASIGFESEQTDNPMDALLMLRKAAQEFLDATEGGFEFEAPGDGS